MKYKNDSASKVLLDEYVKGIAAWALHNHIIMVMRHWPKRILNLAVPIMMLVFNDIWKWEWKLSTKQLRLVQIFIAITLLQLGIEQNNPIPMNWNYEGKL